MTNKLRLRLYRLGLLLLICVCGAQSAFIWSRLLKHTDLQSLVVINNADEFTKQISQAFDLPAVIERYDQVINALEMYHQEQGAYPQTLADLVPSYLPFSPDISIRSGERLKYSPDAKGGPVPFRFYIYGHYPGKASMHEWFLKYCPAQLDLCNETSDQQTYPLRINKRWIWISSLAL
jgi:hypothetical protein